MSRGTPILRIRTGAMEAAVVGALRALGTSQEQTQTDLKLVAAHLDHVVLHPDRLVLRLTEDRDPITVPWSREPTRRRRDIVVPPGRAGENLRPMKVEDRARILKAIATRRAWMDEIVTARIAGPAAIASREILSERAVRMTLSLAQLAPSIVRAIVDGRLPRGLGIRDLADLPPSWAEQERALGM